MSFHHCPMTLPNEAEAAEAVPPRLRLPRRRPFIGVRKRSWGRWVAEIRVPKSSQRLWLGSYATAHQAARAYDVAAVCLRGPGAARNLPMHAVPRPGRNLSPAAIRELAAREADRFISPDEARPAPRYPGINSSSGDSIMQHYSYNSELLPAAADERNLQTELPACDQLSLNPNTDLNYHLSSEAEVDDYHQMSLEELHSLQEWRLAEGEVQTHAYSGAAPFLSEPRDKCMQHLGSVEGHARDRTHTGSPSLLDLWFCLDIGPLVDPSLTALLTHSLYPDNPQPHNSLSFLEGN